MIPYLLYVALLLAVCWMFYKLLLHNETFYRLNRWVLLSCLGICFVLPLFHIPQSWKLVQPAPKLSMLTHVRITEDFDTLRMNPATHQFIGQEAAQLPPPTTPAQTKPVAPAAKLAFHFSFNDIMEWLVIIYWAGVIVFGINLLIQLLVTFYQAYAKQAIVDKGYRIIDLTGDKIPCSFLNTIFINPEKYDWDTYNRILQHEKVHIRQLHSIDIMLAEVAIIFQWFNPFAWLLRREIENNLEYLTDKEVLNDKDIEPAAYQMSLLKVSTPHLSLRITTNYNQSLLKKRITMMNAKRSNIHTLWKYFMLLPLFGGLACALNQPAVSKALILKSKNTNTIAPKEAVADTPTYATANGVIEGLWFATRKQDTIEMQFKTTTNNHTWNDGGNFLVNEFSSIPTGVKGTCTINREAGTMILEGTFDKVDGIGHYKFIPGKKFVAYLSTVESGKFDEHQVMALFDVNVTREYIRRGVVESGYTGVTAENLAALKYFGFSIAELRYWKHSGVQDIDVQSMVGLKYRKVDSSYVQSIQKLGFKDITFSQLMRLKSEDITPEYIKGMVQAARKSGDTTAANIQLSDIISAKYDSLDSTYVSSIAAAGYNLTHEELLEFKHLNVTAIYINEIKELGYNPSYKDITSYKWARITPEFIKAFKDAGYDNINTDDLVALKLHNITPEFPQLFESLGYKKLPIHVMLNFKLQNITPDYITGFNKLGFNNIPAEDLIMLKMSDVTPQYVTAMRQKGLESKDLHKYLTLKTSFKNTH